MTWLRAALGMMALGLLVLAGCTAPAAAVPAAPPATVVAPAPRVTVSPPDGAKGVAPAQPVTVTAANGTLSGVSVTTEDGAALPGTLAADGATWTATANPEFGSTYRFAGTVTGSGGTAPVVGTFRTVAPKRLVKATTTIGDGQTVGVAAPIMIQFNRPVPEASRAAVERALSVTTSQPVTGSWAWLTDAYGGSRVHWRPKDYWPVGTTVKMAAQPVRRGHGQRRLRHGPTSAPTSRIGRSPDRQGRRPQPPHPGRPATAGSSMDLPASYGARSDPPAHHPQRHPHRDGQGADVLMTNPDFGYTNVKMNWAVRISNNGEFIHANPASNWAQGKNNVTHGCINLTAPANAQELLRHRRLRRSGGDHRHLGAALRVGRRRLRLGHPWDQWTKMSALH